MRDLIRIFFHLFRGMDENQRQDRNPIGRRGMQYRIRLREEFQTEQEERTKGRGVQTAIANRRDQKQRWSERR